MEIEAELRATGFARRRGVRVAAPVRAADGQLVTEVDAPDGARFAVLFERAPGARLGAQPSLAQCRAYGRLAAELHSTFDSMQRKVNRFDIDTTHLLDEPLRALKPILVDRPETLESLTAMAELVRSRIKALPVTDGAYGLCHGDLHTGNVLFEEPDRPTLIDFDCCGYGWRAYDLAVFRWDSAGQGSRSAQSRRWNQFLAGYQESRGLPEGFHDALPLFLVARTIWLMGLHVPLARQRVGLLMFSDRYFATLLGEIRGWVQEYPVLRA
jgi:Ser/Thr protein kinase RdoA (MazF antagonist)